MFLELFVIMNFNPKPQDPSFLKRLNKEASQMPVLHAAKKIPSVVVPAGGVSLKRDRHVTFEEGSITEGKNAGKGYRFYSYTLYAADSPKFAGFDEAFSTYFTPINLERLRPFLYLLANEETEGRTKIYLSLWQEKDELGYWKGNSYGEVGIIQLSTADSYAAKYQELLLNPVWAWRAGYDHLTAAVKSDAWTKTPDKLRPLLAMTYYANSHPQVLRAFENSSANPYDSGQLRILLRKALKGFHKRDRFINMMAEKYPQALREAENAISKTKGLLDEVETSTIRLFPPSTLELPAVPKALTMYSESHPSGPRMLGRSKRDYNHQTDI